MIHFKHRIEQFLAQLVGSSYWTATTGEYGIGGLHVAPSIVVSDAVPTSISDARIRTLLAGYLDGTHAEWPPIDGNNVYVVFFPQTTAIAGPAGDTSCQDFGGYHDEGQESIDAGSSGDGGDDAGPEASGFGGAPGSSFAYGVIVRCATFNGLTGIDGVTAETSHELVEAATDPFFRTNKAFALVDFDHLAWNYAGSKPAGSEVGDMCVGTEASSTIYQRMVGGFIVQRTWSNQAAEAGQDPCVPAVANVYFNAAPDLNDTLFVDIPNDPTMVIPSVFTSGVSVPVGQSQTINLRLFSTGPTADWYVGAGEYSVRPTLHLSEDKGSGNNGDVIQLTVTRTTDGPLPGSYSEIAILSSPTATFTPGAYQVWNVFVGK
jgi:hypothetical protein